MFKLIIKLLILIFIFCSKIYAADVGIEIIIFTQPNPNKNNLNNTKELFPKHLRELNTKGITEEPCDLINPLNIISTEYNKLKRNQNYKIILHASKQYNLLPSQKHKKLLIQSENFTGILIITPIPNRNNYFNVTFDGMFNNIRLTKTAKIKNKELYYFDHPVFGALFTIFS
jgi:hypothetical protein